MHSTNRLVTAALTKCTQMPEGDTVWLTAHRLHQALGGRVLTHFELSLPTLSTVQRTGATVREVAARGKHLLTRLDSGETLHTHLRMDGSYRIARTSSALTRPTWPRHHVRVLLANSEWAAVGLRVHDVRLIATANESDVVGHLGPDLLGPDWSLEQALQRLRADPQRDIGEALLDQRNLAGIGNLYKSECLFMSKVNPWQQIGAVADLEAVITLAQRLLLLNRDHPEQSTTASTRRGEQHWVYLRAGQQCLRCRTTIRSAQQGPPGKQRVTYWCPRCQPAVE